jgi:hypothetical protein
MNTLSDAAGVLGKAARWMARGGLALLLLVAPALLWKSYSPSRATGCSLLVDMTVGDSPTAETGPIEVWLNDTSSDPLRETASPGTRRTYRFDLVREQALSFIRVDPTTIANVETRVYGIRIEHDGETLRAFAPADLARWYTNCERAELQGDALVLRASHADPILTGDFPPIVLPGIAKNKLLLFCHTLVPRERKTLLLAFSALLVLVLGLISGARLQAIIVGLSLPLTYGALRLVSSLGGRPPDPSTAVGYACYAGYPKSLEFLEVGLLVAIPTMVALVFAWLMRISGWCSEPPGLSRRDQPAGSPEEKPRPILRWAKRFLLALLAVGLAAYCFPDLAAIRASFTAPISLGWDANNFHIWRYLVQDGARPLRDFWYPYSGFSLLSLRFPYGELLTALNIYALFTIFLLAVYRNTRRSMLATLAIFGAVFLLFAGRVFDAAERYGLIVNAVLAYLAIDREARRPGWGHLLFWVAAVHLCVMEPIGVLYAGVPIFASWCLEALRGLRAFFSQLPRRLVREFGVPAVVLAGCIAFLAARGQLSGFLEFMASLGTQAGYSSYPVDVKGWLRFSSPGDAFLLGATIFLTGAGLGLLFGRTEPEQRTGRAVFLLGLAGALLLLKHMVRPHVTYQINYVPVVGLLFYLFGVRRIGLLQKGGVLLAAGGLFAYLAAGSIPRQILEQVRSAPERIASSAPLLMLSHQERRALTEERYSRDRFQLDEGHREVVRALDAIFATEGRQPIFVLSDDPVFYMLTKTRPYFHTNFYNAAPIKEQQRIVRLLEATPPRVIIWKPTDPGVDMVPPVVRDPLVFDHVIRHYVPMASLQSYELLRLRRPDEPVAVEFWHMKLGSVVHLGHIPRFSAVQENREDKDPREEAEILTVRVTDPETVFASPAPPGIPELPQLGGYHTSGHTIALPVECAGQQFTVALSVVPGQSEYHIRLDRIWFWGPLRKAGFCPSVGQVGPGVEAHVDRRPARDDVLY